MLDWLLADPLPPGAPAPDFALTDENDRTVSLSQLRGKIFVLVFYPGDDTPVCTTQLCEIRDDWSHFQKLGVRVFGVNGSGADSHGKFVAKHRLPFPLLVDKGWSMCRAYRCGWGIIRRTVYVIGPDGRIVYAKRGKPPAAEILAAVEGRRPKS